MRSRCFWPEVKILFFKKVRDVFGLSLKKLMQLSKSYNVMSIQSMSPGGTLYPRISDNLVKNMIWDVRALRNGVRSSPLDVF